MSEAWDAFEVVVGLDQLRRTTFRTPGAGNSSKPFTVAGVTEDSLEVRTARGGRISLRSEAFPAAVKAVGDLGEVEEDGWVRTSDETLVMLLQAENRDKACASYVLPLLEAAGFLELSRGRPSKARLRPGP